MSSKNIQGIGMEIKELEKENYDRVNFIYKQGI